MVAARREHYIKREDKAVGAILWIKKRNY